MLGRPRYLADLRPEGLLHGRVLRPPSPGARLAELASDWKAPASSWSATARSWAWSASARPTSTAALERLARDAAWDEPDTLPDEDDLSRWLRAGPHEEIEVLDEDPPARRP